jgi:hypothetical protein
MNILHARSPLNNRPRSWKCPALPEVPQPQKTELICNQGATALCYDCGQTLSQVPLMSQLDQRRSGSMILGLATTFFAIVMLIGIGAVIAASLQ